MPIYEFRCVQCQKKFERLCPMGEDGLNLACPSCGAPAPKRLVSAFSAPGTEGGKGSECGSCTASSCAGCR
ncbi:MAG: zinc ribbon domain-containing protein [Candidatus Desulforudis sp.]|nr:zinc ribbon domain-containing protein [Desulforudis sp.]